MSNTAWTLILVAVLLAASVYGWFFHRQRFLVIACHNAVWIGALALIGSELIDYKESATGSWLMLAAGLVAFNAGVWASTWIDRVRKVATDDVTSAVPAARVMIVTRRTLWIMFAVYAVGFASYLINIQVRFGLDKLIFDPAPIRADPTYLETVPLPLRLLLYIGPLLFAILGVKDAVDVPLPLALRLGLMVALLASMATLLQRTNLFMAILILIAVLLTRGLARRKDPSDAAGGRRQVVRLVAIIAICGVVALGAFQAIAISLGKNGEQALGTGAVSAPLAQSGLTSPFVYYTAGTVALLRLMQSTNPDWPPEHVPGQPDVVGDYNPQTWGVVTFAPIVKLLPFVEPWSSDAYMDTGVATNVYTWFSPFYRDFRLAGIVVGMLLLGWIAGTLFARRYRSTRVFWAQAVVFTVIFMAPFAAKYNDTLVLCVLLLIVVLTLTWPAWWRRFLAPAPRERVAS
jgi:hypothetical protein